MEIPIIGKPELGPYPINMFYSPAAHKGLNLPGLMGTPGLKEYYDPSHTYPVRGLHVMGSKLYAVIGKRVYEIDSTPTGTLLVGTMDGDTKPVFMEDDGTNLMIVEPNVEGYLLGIGGPVTAIVDPDFTVPSALTWQDGYFIATEKDSGRFWIPTVYDPTAWLGTDWTTAETMPDDAFSILSDHSEVLVFGSASIQYYYNSGNAAFPFEVVQGATIQEGIGAVHSPVRGDNLVSFVDVHGRIMLISGHSAQPISSRAIEKEITGYSTFADAISYYYAHQGHGFFVFAFPSGNTTWAFDVSTQMWHKRESYPVNIDGTRSRWRGNCHAFYDGKHIIGDYENGKLYELDFDTYKDNDETIIRTFDFPAIGDGQNKIRHNNLKVDYKAGVGIVGDTPTAGVDPQAMLKWSDDGKKTWSNERSESIGKIGEYDKEVNFRRLSASKRREYRNVVSDPVEVVVTGAKLT